MTGFFDSIWSSIVRTGAVYLTLIVILFAADSLGTVPRGMTVAAAPIWPLSLYTLIWMLALAFPITACLYIIFDLRVRLNQVEDSAYQNRVYDVYFPHSQKPDIDFRHLLNLKFRQSCNPWELSCFGLAAGVVAFMVQYFPLHWAGLNSGMSPEFTEIAQTPSSIWIVLSGFFGAFSGALVLILKKHRTLDIYPTTYFQASIGLILGPLVGGFIASSFAPSSGSATTLSFGTVKTVTAFALGFVTATNVNFLGSLLRRQVAAMTSVPLPTPVPGNLDTLIENSEAVESLNNMSCFSIAEFVSMEPIILYLSMPQPINCLDQWFDQALLAHYFQPHIAALNAVDIKRFTQLLEYLIDSFPAGGGTVAGITWKPAFQITGDNPTDHTIGTAAQALVTSEIHHRLLAILSQKYRRAFF